MLEIHKKSLKELYKNFSRYFSLMIGEIIALASIGAIIIAFTFMLNRAGILDDSNTSVYELLMRIITIVILIPIAYGIVASYIKIMNEKIGMFKFINIAIDNLGKSWKITLNILLKLIPWYIVLLIGIFIVMFATGLENLGKYFNLIDMSSNTNIIAIIIFKVAGLIVILVSLINLMSKILDYIFSYYIAYYSDKNTSAKEILKNSMEVMSKNKIKYIVTNALYWIFKIMLVFVGGVLFNFNDNIIMQLVLILIYSIVVGLINIYGRILYIQFFKNIEI
ncbi:MAG: hypothetical protein IJH12_06100 [Clostridia bacterium]|nr:hypothetical protein [Clostridia bacterium]